VDLLGLLLVCDSFVDTPYFFSLYLVSPDDRETIIHDSETDPAVMLLRFPGINSSGSFYLFKLFEFVDCRSVPQKHKFDFN
jgi:hypothetical protein